MKLYKTLISLAFFSIMSCHCEVENIKVSELLDAVAYDRNIDYCGLLKSSLKGDQKAIKEFSLLDFGDGTSYDHGSVLVDVILNIGEENYLEAIKDISEEEKREIFSYIEVGTMYHYDETISNKIPEQLFPKLTSFLKIE